MYIKVKIDDLIIINFFPIFVELIDDDFDYEERLNEIHIELDGLNEEAITLANAISENFKTVLI